MIITKTNECTEWARRYQVQLDEQGRPVCCNNTTHRLRGGISTAFSKLLSLARHLESLVYIDSQCLVWVTGWGIFGSAENLQLFYRYRQSYGNNLLLAAAPGHVCLSYERAEVATLVWLSMLQGWDVHVFSDIGSTSVFISHDQWFEVGFTEFDACREKAEELRNAKIDVEITRYNEKL